MKYGYFDDKNKEYVITNPLTPNPWINYLGSDGYYGLISNTGGGYTFYEDAKLRRITRYRYNNVPTDFGGRYYYINDGKNIWNPGFLPMKTKLDSYQCQHGMGYSMITGSKDGLKASVKYFIPKKEQVELHVVTLTNESDTEKNIKLFGMVEWALWNAVDDQTNFQRNLNIGEVEVEGSTIYHKTEYRERRNHFAYYHVNHELSGFDTDRLSFLGAYNGWESPEVVVSGESKNSMASGGSPIASLALDVQLKPGESKSFVYQLGYIENKEEDKFVAPDVINKEKVYTLLEKYNSVSKVNVSFNELKEFWDDTLSKYSIESDQPVFNRMVNIWHQYQCMTTFNMSRSASYFESGTGRGMGFRDSCQDILGFVHMIPERSRERILDLAAIQLPDGSTYHQYQPLTKKGNADVGSGFNDDPLWLIGAVSAYIRETGDYTILDEMVPFNNEIGSEKTLFTHLQTSINFTLNNMGPHDLPLIGRADWNDCLNLNCFSKTPGESFQTTENNESGNAESIFIAGMFVKYGQEYIDICQAIDKKDEAKRVSKAVEKVSNAVIKDGWDGDWYLRAYDAYGQKVGSHENEEGKIYVEPQGFCTMAKIGGKAYGEKALKHVDKYLVNDFGAELLYPPYSKYHIELGEISTYPPGYKENGSVFCHNNPWIVIGYTTINDAEKAFDLYKRNAPAFIEDKSEIHKTEPYVYSQTIAGRSAAHYGEAKNSWLTGTASWTFLAVSQHILGIRPHLEGLEIDPVLSKEINQVKVKRTFRGAQFDIEIVRDESKTGQLLVNNKLQDSKVIKVDSKQKEYQVVAYI
jgi:cellobiose phosphorylase